MVDDLVRPIMGSNAAVQESEHKRVVAESSPLVAVDEEVPVGKLREKMTYEEVRTLLGKPDLVEDVVTEGTKQVRWTYREAARILLFERGRLVSIAIR